MTLSTTADFYLRNEEDRYAYSIHESEPGVFNIEYNQDNGEMSEYLTVNAFDLPKFIEFLGRAAYFYKHRGSTGPVKNNDLGI
jgi:hypothetical protein|tara:strand:+ start:319 stop:567 length:249 start_codon:yes stop_codon:yes gene_type:complete